MSNSFYIKLFMKKNILLLFTGLFASTTGFCQINIPANSLVKENFNTIGSTATATLPSSWKMSSAGTGASSGYATGNNVTATTQAASSGTPTTGGRYNWATTPGTDRAIGFMSDAGYADGNAIFADYKNTTGATITSVNLSYSIERYRINTGSASVALFSSTDGIAWTARSAGDISAAVFTPGASSYTFTSPQTVYKNITISGISIANNTDIYFRWVFTTGGTNSQGLGLDDVVLYAPPATPDVTGSMRDNLQVDNNADGQAGAGDQLRYTTVVRNKGTSDATGVTFTNLTPPNTTLNPGSVKTSALARDDNYNTAQNTLLTGTTVLANDFGLPAPTVISFGPVSDATTTANGTNTAKSDNGGTVLMNTDGTFTYTPATGFAGFDRFSYVATTGTAPDNAGVVTITVGSSTITTGAAESYNVAGNVSITTPASGTGNLLNNDTGNGLAIGSVNGSSSSVGNPITTANGGTLTVNSNGSFTYNPAPGYEGPDNFTYTVDNGYSNPSAPVTVTLTVAGMVWYIDNNYAGAVSDGRLGTPFKTIAAFQAINNGTGNNPAANDNIFIYESATDYNGNISLLNGQKLIGQDATATLATLSGITLPLYSATFPVTNSANGTIVRLITTAAATNAISLVAGASNTVRGLTIGNTTGAKLFSGGFGTLTIGDNSLPDVTLNGSGQAMNLSAGTFGASSGLVSVTSTSSGTQGINLSGIAGTVSFGSTNISGSGTQGILIGTTTATINFGNTVVSAGTDGVSFQNNSGANIKSFGTLNITTTGVFSSFLHANGGGAVTAGVTTISNGTGNGIDIQNNTTTVSFGTTTVTKSGAGNAISIANTTATAGNVTFSGVNLGTAGTRLTGPAISIVNTGGTNTSVYDFGAVSIFTNGATGIIATNVDGTINMASGTVDVTGASAMNISGPAGFTALSITLGTVNANGGTNALNFTNCSGGAVLGATAGALAGTAAGAAFNVTGGTISVTYSGGITQAANAAMVAVNGGHSIGTLAFGGALNATLGTGLQFDNADGTYNFSGVVTLNGGDAGIDVLNGSSGTINISNTSSNINNPSGELVKLNASSANFTYSGAFTKNNNATNGIFVNAETGGTIKFDGLNTIKTISTTTGTAVNLTSNTGATINFSGNNLLLTTTSGTGFIATGGGTVSIAGTGNTIASTTGTAINVLNTTIGGSGITFQSINQNAGNASNSSIVLNTTGTGAFTVTGTGNTAGTGGTIQNIQGADAVKLTSTGGLVTLKNMNIQDITSSTDASAVNDTHSNVDAIHGVNVNAGLTLNNVSIQRISDNGINGSVDGAFPATSWNGLTLTNCTFNNTNRFNVAGHADATGESAVYMYGLKGTVSVTGCTFQNASSGLFIMTDVAGSLDMTVQSNNFLTLYKEIGTLSIGLFGINVTQEGSLSSIVRIGDQNDVNPALGNTFTNGGDRAAIRVITETGSTGPMKTEISRNTFTVTDHTSPGQVPGNQFYNFPQSGVLLRGLGTGNYEGIFSTNSMNQCMHADGGLGNLSLLSESGSSEFIVQNNTFSLPWDAPVELRADGQSGTQSGAAVLFQNNTYVDGTVGDATSDLGGQSPYEGFFVAVRNSGKLDLTQKNETLGLNDNTSAVNLSFYTQTTLHPNVLNLFLQNVHSPWGYRLSQNAPTTFNLYRNGSGAGTAQLVLQANGNTGGGGADGTNPPTVNQTGVITLSNTAPTLPNIIIQ